MRLLLVAALASGLLACETEPPPVPDEVDAGPVVISRPDGGPTKLTNSFRNDAGIELGITTGLYLPGYGQHSVVLLPSEDTGLLCEGGPIESGHVELRINEELGVLPGGDYFAADGGVSRFRVRDENGEYFQPQPFASTVSIVEASESRLAGRFHGPEVWGPGGPQGGTISGEFNVGVCPSFIGSGENTVNGQLGFAVESAVYTKHPSSLSVMLSTLDDAQSMCSPTPPSSNFRLLQIAISPADVDQPVGTYTREDHGAELWVYSVADGGIQVANISRAGSVEITGADGGHLSGTYWADLDGKIGIARIEGRFEATLCQ